MRPEGFVWLFGIGAAARRPPPRSAFGARGLRDSDKWDGAARGGAWAGRAGWPGIARPGAGYAMRDSDKWDAPPEGGMGRPGRLAEAARPRAGCAMRDSDKWIGGERRGTDPSAGPVWLGRMRAGGAALSKNEWNITRTIRQSEGNRWASDRIVDAGALDAIG